MPRRPSIPYATERLIWARAAGRCTLCNRLASENEDLGEVVSIGELAHNVGWSEKSPRGNSDLTEEQRAAPENLVLLCRNCHKPVDDGGAINRYSVEALARFKKEHEQRVAMLTEVGGDRTATIVRVVGAIRGVQPELSRDVALNALVRSGHFPELLPNTYWPEYELDLRSIREPLADGGFAASATQIDALVQRIKEGVRLGAVTRLAIFGFARIPVLIYLGATLDDKIDTLVFQRQRVDNDNAWSWPEDGVAVDFQTLRIRDGQRDRVAVVINLSGVIGLEALPPEQQEISTLYSITPSQPAIPDPGLFTSPVSLANFARSLRTWLASVEREHGGVERIDVFAAVPVSAAVTIGRVLMPNVSPALRVFDRDRNGEFSESAEVKR